MVIWHQEPAGQVGRPGCASRLRHDVQAQAVRGHAGEAAMQPGQFPGQHDRRHPAQPFAPCPGELVEQLRRYRQHDIEIRAGVGNTAAD